VDAIRRAGRHTFIDFRLVVAAEAIVTSGSKA
jgi:hypothetical protein